ncbi:glycoside hydrolase [Streptomyces niger]|uniref:glycoside hydrolase n=1 Tax=Streptomyces niger TaxID=66373 RepID=UPI00069A4923|nr:glycoside hydrolase [Streptomyces niger]
MTRFLKAATGSRKRRAALAALAGTALTASTFTALQAYAGPAAPGNDDSGTVALRIKGGEAHVDPRTMRITARTASGTESELSAAAGEPLGTVSPVTRHGATARWSYPDRGLDVSVAARDGRLVVRMHATKDGSIAWPAGGAAQPRGTAYELPRGEGLRIPAADTFWNSEQAGLTGEDGIDLKDLTMPFWGTTAGDHGVSTLVPTDLGTNVRFVSQGGRLHTAASHDFRRADGTGDYTVALSLTDGSPVAAAKDYRRYLASKGQLGSLKAKIRKNPEVAKLIGAPHAYVWGDGRSKETVARLKKLGISRMWFGYDADGDPMSKEAVAAAQKAGYLVGPYDSWDNAQDPKSADTSVAKWPDRVWPDGCVHDADGKPVGGFGGRGCYLSSQALAAAEPGHHYLADRVRDMSANGVHSYFLDVDATGELFRDHTPGHPMTQAKDRANRLQRMRGVSGGALTGGRPLVLGSESAGSWANQVLDFSHGSSTPVHDGLWKAERDKETWGGYWPKGRPGMFFKPAKLDASVAKAMFDPAYRVPLYETVLHDSVVSTDRWELPLYKLPEQKRDRALLAMLYNTPVNLALDGKVLDAHGKEIAELQRFFAGIQQAGGTEAMTDFRTLTADRSVQRTTFGGSAGLTVTANFGTEAYKGLPGGCVRATTRGHAPQRFCPEK